MKNVVIVGGVIIVVLAAAFYFLSAEKDTADVLKNEEGEFSQNGEQWMRHNDRETGVQFAYRINPNGYRLTEEEGVVDDLSYIKAFVLMDIDDAAEMEVSIGAHEFPPAITMQVFRDTENMSSLQWATTYERYSDINLAFTEVSTDTVAGEEAIRYRADGLYVNDTIVVANGGFVYVIRGAFIDEDSQIRRDFEPFVHSIVFIETERTE